MPKIESVGRRDGTDPPPPIADDLRQKLSQVSVATLTSQLLKRGFRNTFVSGLRTTRPELRLVGRAFTLRYVPAREDVAFQVDYDNDVDVQRLAVEAIGPGDVLVIDARGVTSAASFGHILSTRIMRRGAAGVVTDGALRDTYRFSDLDLPVYFRAPHATTSSVAHYAADMRVPIGCSGVLVMPGDTVVGDAEGVVIIPARLTAEIATAAAHQELVEEFALERIRGGSGIGGLYPLSATAEEEFQQWCDNLKSRSPESSDSADVRTPK
jgi:regulator of RNase E activity RraA